MGILDSLGFGAPQPDPMQAQQAPQPGIGTRINQGIADNSGMMMALGGQLLAHRNNAANAPFDAQALMVGQQMDEKRKKEREEREKERRGRAAAIQSMIGMGYTEQQATNIIDVHPDFAAKALEKKHLSEPETHKPTSLMQNLQAAGYEPGTPEYIAKMNELLLKPGQTINVGPQGQEFAKPTFGQEYRRNPDGTVFVNEEGLPEIVQVPGGPADVEAQQAEQAQQNQQEQTARYGDVVLQDIARTKKRVQEAPWYSPAAGLGAETLSGIGGTNAADVKELTGTVRANVGFDRLQAMREASPTGGALGQVTERELGFLQATLGSLEQSQSKEQLLENLDRLEQIYSHIMRKAAAYPNAREFGFTDPETGDGWQEIAPGVRIREVR